MPARFLAALWLAMVAAGCGGSDGRLPTVPVELSIFHADKPATGAVVSLVPLPNTPASERGLKATGAADVNGTVGFSTYVPGDGAPEGQCKVVIYWPAERTGPEAEAERLEWGQALPQDRLKGKYGTPEATPFTVTIERGKTLERINLP